MPDLARKLYHLLCEVTGRHDHEGAHLPWRRAALARLDLPQTLHQRSHVCERLAAAGRIREKHVLMTPHRLEAQRLGTARACEAERLQVRREPWRRAERLPTLGARGKEGVVHVALGGARPPMARALRARLGLWRSVVPLFEPCVNRSPRFVVGGLSLYCRLGLIAHAYRCTW